MQKISITVDMLGRPPTVNAERRQTHWSQRSKITKEWREAAAFLWMEAKNQFSWDVPNKAVVVILQPLHATRHTPQDAGACYPAAKAAIDGAVDAGIIQEDGPEWVSELRMFAPKRGCGTDGLCITITKSENE